MFVIGDKVIYAQMGVCEVQDITIPSFCERGAEKEYYVLKPCEQTGAIFVPVDANVYMRKLLTREEANRLIDMIPDVQTHAYDTASMQDLKAQYSEAMQSHDCGDLLELIMSIYTKKQTRIKNNKKISAIDESTMKRAEDLLYGELAIALGIAKDAVPKYIAKRLRASGAAQAKA